MTDDQDPDEARIRRIQATMPLLFSDCVLDVEEVEWQLDDFTLYDPEVTVAARDEPVKLRTNGVGIVGQALKLRSDRDDSEVEPHDDVTAREMVETLNTPGCFAIDKLAPSPADEVDPCWRPRFVLSVEDGTKLAEIAKPSWDQIGRAPWRIMEEPE